MARPITEKSLRQMKRRGGQALGKDGKALGPVPPPAKKASNPEPIRPDPMLEVAATVKAALIQTAVMVEKSSRANQQGIERLADKLGESLQAAKPQVFPSPDRPKRWTFEIQRDARGFIETIEAKAS